MIISAKTRAKSHRILGGTVYVQNNIVTWNSLCLLCSGVYKLRSNLSFDANSDTHHKYALVGSTTATKYKQDLRCTHKAYTFLQKTIYNKGFRGYDEMQGCENAMEKDTAMGYITASVEISLHSLAAQSNADSLCKILKVKP